MRKYTELRTHRHIIRQNEIHESHYFKIIFSIDIYIFKIKTKIHFPKTWVIFDDLARNSESNDT